MKNWLIILIIFIVPMGLYGFLSSNSSVDAFIEKIASNETVEQTIVAEKPASTSKCSLPVLYKFYSTLCKDCQKQTKELKGLKEEFENKIEFNEVNVSGASGESGEVQELIKKYNIKVVPTVVITDCSGKIIKKYDSVATHSELQKVLKNVTMSGVK